MWRSLHTIGTVGSENGDILSDEEYKDACRITLEKCKKYYAITCGVYGVMVHTAFSDGCHYQEMYEAMKKDLQEFVDKETSCDEELVFCNEFTSRY